MRQIPLMTGVPQPAKEEKKPLRRSIRIAAKSQGTDLLIQSIEREEQLRSRFRVLKYRYQRLHKWHSNTCLCLGRYRTEIESCLHRLGVTYNTQATALDKIDEAEAVDPEDLEQLDWCLQEVSAIYVKLFELVEKRKK